MAFSPRNKKNDTFVLLKSVLLKFMNAIDMCICVLIYTF